MGSEKAEKASLILSEVFRTAGTPPIANCVQLEAAALPALIQDYLEYSGIIVVRPLRVVRRVTEL